VRALFLAILGVFLVAGGVALAGASGVVNYGNVCGMDGCFSSEPQTVSSLGLGAVVIFVGIVTIAYAATRKDEPDGSELEGT
jgi:uncharacterized membrane protein YidH (DUF202 family)